MQRLYGVGGVFFPPALADWVNMFRTFGAGF